MRDHRAVGLHDARGDVGLQTAECDGHAWVHAQGHELGSLDRVQELGRLAEVLVNTLFDQLAVAVIGRLQRRRVAAHLLGQTLDGGGAGILGLAGDRGLVAILHAAVGLLAAGDVPAAVAAGAGDGVADRVLIAPLVDDTLAAVVDDEAGLAVDADAAGQARVHDLHGRVLVVERADLLGGRQTVADVAVRHVAEVVRDGVARDHFLVAGIAAGREDDASSRVERELGAALARARHTGDDARLVREDLVHGGVVDDLAAEVVFIVQRQGRGDLAAFAVGLSATARGVVHAPRLQADVDGLDVEHVKVRLEHAILLHGLGQRLPRLREDFRGVALHGRLDGGEPVERLVEVIDQVAVFRRVHELAVAVADVHEVVIDHVLRVVQALLFLPLRAGAEELAAASRGGTAGDALLFDDDDVRTDQLRLNGCGQTACARAAHDHVDCAHFVLIFRRLRGGSGLERGNVLLGCTGGLERRRRRVEDGGARQICAIDRGDVQRLVLHDQLGVALHRCRVQAPGNAAVFLVLRHFYGFDLIFRYRHVDDELAAVAAAGALVGSRIVARHI